MNDSDETAQAAGYKAGDVIPMFLSGSTFFLSWILAKACGNDGLAITSCWKFWKECGTFREKNEEVLKFYGGKKL
jgi:hypothetical protein